MNELPAVVQAVLDAVADWRESWTDPTSEKDIDLAVAFDAYRKSIAPPEPWDIWYVRPDDPDDERYRRTYTTGDPASELVLQPGQQLWRCTVTPIERVR